LGTKIFSYSCIPSVSLGTKIIDDFPLILSNLYGGDVSNGGGDDNVSQSDPGDLQASGDANHHQEIGLSILM
jgi:hypothetical protein